MTPAECERIIQDYFERKKQFGHCYNINKITPEHIFYRFISERYIDKNNNKAEPPAFDQAGMSVFVEGPGFIKIDFEKIIKENPIWVAWAKISANKFIPSLDKFIFTIYHDPLPFFNKNENSYKQQHPNHALIICKKNATNCTLMQQAAQLNTIKLK